MNPVLRRTLTFVVMVAAGLATILLLAEDSAAPVRSIGSGRGGGGRGLQLVDRADNTREGIDLGQVEFSVNGDVELPDGSVVERPVYRVNILSGSPDAQGFYIVDQPVITFLDELSGEPRGELRAVQGRFDTGGGGLGDGFGLDVSQMMADNFSLEGDVRGELPLADGSSAELHAERLDVDRRTQTVRGPGEVSWSRGGLSLRGLDLLWDGATRELSYASDTTLSVRDADTAAVTTLSGAGGLRWTLPEGGRGHGELLGPVSGADEFGHSLSAERLLADADRGELRLRGRAELRQGLEGGGARRFAADELRVSRDELGELHFEEAVGRVRVVAFDSEGGASSFDCERLVRDGETLRGPGSVRWMHQGLHAEGRELRFDQASDELRILHDVELVGTQDAPEAWRDARLSSPRGLRWAGAVTSLAGPVVGSLPDGTRLSGETLDVDRDQGLLQLLGHAWIERTLSAEEGSQRFEAQELQLWRNAEGGWERVHAERQVRLLVSTPDEDPLELLAGDLERVGRRVRIRGAFTASQGPLSLAGRGLVLDETARQADVLAEATLRTLGDDTRGPAELHAPAGLTWWFGPAGSAVSAGHGELRGPVSGHDAEGGALEAQLVRVRGAADELELLGGARVLRAPADALSGAELLLVQRPEGLLARAPSDFTLQREDLRLEGADLTWDAAAGTIDVRQDVTGEHPQWGRFEATGLHAREFEGLLELRGPCRLERESEGWLSAATRLELRLDDAGVLRSVIATGDVRAEVAQAGVTMRLAADELRRDQLSGLTQLFGAVELEREDLKGLTRLHTEPGAEVSVQQDVSGALSHAVARGRVLLQRDDLRAETDLLVWDVVDDHLRLEGNCRFLATGAWMSMERVEIWPSQMRWFVPRAEMEFAPTDDG